MSESACSCSYSGRTLHEATARPAITAHIVLGIAKMKAMRERIAIQKHFVRNTLESFCFFAQAFGVRTRPPRCFSCL